MANTTNVNTTNNLRTRAGSVRFLNRDFESFRPQLEEFARTFFPSRPTDFTANGFGGLLLDLASWIGDNNSFYLDHQFGELSAETAVEPQNVERLLRDAGVPVVGAAPAVLEDNAVFYVRIPGDGSGSFDRTALPIIRGEGNTTAISNNGVEFQLLEDVDFTLTKSDGTPVETISYTPGDIDANTNLPLNYIFSKAGTCISSQTAVETFTVTGFEPFKRVTLQNRDVTDVVSVVDSAGNTYYEVEFLTQGTVFKSTDLSNIGVTSSYDATGQPIVKSVLEVIPAPYRFYKTTSLDTRFTTLTFGGATGDALDDDLVPDPSEVALPLYGKRSFSRFAIDPNNLFRTSTLGVIAPNVTLIVTYRHGGGASHNIGPDSLAEISTLTMDFPGNPAPAIASSVRLSADVNNTGWARGGDDAPTVDDLRLQIPAARAAQSRIVSKQDLLTRVYRLPANFGRVYRVSVHSNPTNPNSSLVYVLSKNADGTLTISPDLLKKSLATYLNEFRMISEGIDILDGQIINLSLNYQVTVDPSANRQIVLQNCQARLSSFFDQKNFHMDQPISIDDVRNVVFTTPGVIGVRTLEFQNITGTVAGRVYSGNRFDVNTNTVNGGFIIPPPGGIFEIKYKYFDIVGRTSA
jgi:hypothetical protein